MDVLHACRRGWDIVVFQGTGGLADCIAAALAKEEGGSKKAEAKEELQQRKKETGGAEQHLNGLKRGNTNMGGNTSAMIGGVGMGVPAKDVVVEEIVSTGKIALISVDKDDTEEFSSVISSRLLPSHARGNEGLPVPFEQNGMSRRQRHFGRVV